jgi:hypothetical protein
MRILKPYSSFLLLFLFMVGACSVNKRHYMPGYQVDWKKGKVENQGSEMPLRGVQNRVIETTDVQNEPAESPEIVASANKILLLSKKENTGLLKRSNFYITLKNTVKKQYERTEFHTRSAAKPNPPLHPLVIPALICGALGLIIGITGIPAVFMAIKARKAIKDNPGSYSGDALGLMALILGIAGCFTTLVILFVLLIFLLLA